MSQNMISRSMFQTRNEKTIWFPRINQLKDSPIKLISKNITIMNKKNKEINEDCIYI